MVQYSIHFFYFFVKLYISDTNIHAAKVSLYFLEESRICMQNPGESNFHALHIIFQQIPKNLTTKLYLDALPTFAYLNNYKTHTISGFQSFTNFDMALSAFGYTTESKNLIYAWLAAILHLGEIQFDQSENNYVSDVSESSKVFLNYAANLLNIKADQLMKAMLEHEIRSTNEVYA